MQKRIDTLRQKFRAGRLALFRRVAWDRPSSELLEGHAELVDALLKEIYAVSCQEAEAKTRRTERSGLAIVATGGYGRRELHPYSDVDIAFVPSEEEDPWVEAVVHTAFKLVMDVFLSLRDIHVGYAFRPVAEAAAWDVRTKTALLDARHVCGDSTLASRLSGRIREVLSPLDIMLESRAGKDPNGAPFPSLYSVEPSLKEGPGSLRDLHRARWIFQLLLGVDGRALDPALRHGAGIPERQLAEVQRAADWFWRARTWTHLAAGKLSDVLITNYQDRIAGQLGDCSAQEWLSRHLAHAETLARFRETAVRCLLQGPLTVQGVLLEDGSLHRMQLSADQASAANLFLVAQRYSIPVSLTDLKRLEESRAAALDVGAPSADEVWAFNRILDGGPGVAATVRALSDFGILDRFIPKFSDLMRFVPPDPAHSHSVGEHSMRMVAHLESLRAGRDPGERRFAELLGQCGHFDMLCLAALLHDAGKLEPGTDHCSAGARLAASVADRLWLPPEKREMLDTLVRHHLLLVRTARLHDLKSPHVIRSAVAQVPGLEALRHLYLFTYVDTRAVAENNWTSMDLRDLEDLYIKMQESLAGRPEEGPGAGKQEERSVRVRKKLAALHSRNGAAVLKHCDTMPAGYVLNTPLEEIAFHLQLLDRLERETVVFDLYNRPGDDYSELTVCVPDDPTPGILAKIAGVLYACGADIHRAQAFTLKQDRRIVLDTLWIRSNGMQISENRARRMRSAMQEVLTGARTLDGFLERAGKLPPGGVVLDSIDLRNDLSEEHTVVHIVAHDLQGLLYQMTRALSRCGLDIHSAKIATWNARAENNFYVTCAGGGQIADAGLKGWAERIARALRGDP